MITVSLPCFGHRVSYWWSSGVLHCLVTEVLALPVYFPYLFPNACGERRYLFLRREAVDYSVTGVLCPSLQEEEEASEEDSNVKPDFTITMKTDFNVRSFLDQLEDEADGFVSPVDDKMPSRSNQDMGLSNLHEASMYV